MLDIPVERAAAVKDRIARKGLTGSVTMAHLLRERLHDRA